MARFQKGMMAWSLAGHDRGRLYVIVGVDEEYAYLSDGRLRPLESPKKKKWKHLQIIKRIPKELESVRWDTIKNEDIKFCLKNRNREEMN